MSVFKQTVVSKLSNALSPVIRELGNLSVALAGTKVLVVRTKVVSVDEWDEVEEGVETFVIDNAVLIYPANNVRVSSVIDGDDNILTALSIMDLLPVKMRVKFKNNKETYEDNSINVKVGDLIIDLKLDENLNKIPIILKISKIDGFFFEKNLVGLEYQLTRQTGIIEEEIADVIKDYLNG